MDDVKALCTQNNSKVNTKSTFISANNASEVTGLWKKIV